MATEYRIVARLATGAVKRGRQEIVRELGAVESAAGRMRRSLIGAAGGAAFGAAITKATRDAAAFQTRIAEVSTLVDEATFNMRGLEQAALDQARAFGSMPDQQAAAFYNIISAGAGTAAEATDILDTANKLAVGGVTDVDTAAKGLSSTLNAYGFEASEAGRVSDILFAGMKGGQTTIGELVNGLGKVAPLAAGVGVSFEELTASVSALTKGGISTQESITGVRAILAAVTKPTSEASKLASDLGLEFSAAALEAQGLAGFLENLRDKTGGNNEQLAVLFGGVEAIIPAMALAGAASEDFASILESATNSAGLTNEAFEKMSDTAEFKFNQAMANVTVTGIQLGSTLLDVLVPALEFVNANFDAIVTVVSTGVVVWGTYQAVIITATLAQTAWNSTAVIAGRLLLIDITQKGAATAATGAMAAATGAATAATRAFTAALASNPLGLVAVAIATVVGLLWTMDSAQDAAAASALENANAQAASAEQEAKRAQMVAALNQQTEQERQFTIAAAEAAVVKAKADRQAAIEATRRALAEAKLADQLARQASRRALLSGPTSNQVASNGNLPEQRAAKEAAEDLAAARRGVAEAAGEVIAREKDLAALRNAGNIGTPALANINVPSISGLGTGNGPGAANDNGTTNTDNRSTFEEIRRRLEQERDLAKEVGIERDVLRAIIDAESQVRGGKLEPAQRAQVESIIRETDAIQRQQQYREQVLDSLNDEAVLLTKTGIERDVLLEQMRAENILQRTLTEAEAKDIETRVRQNDLIARTNELYERINGPADDYARTLEAMNKLLQEGSVSQRQYNLALSETDLARNLNQLDGELGGDFGQNAELERIRNQQAARLEIIRQAREQGLIDQRDYEARETAIQVEANRQRQELRRADLQIALGSASAGFGELATASKEALGEQSAIYKGMFAASKAFAIAESIIKIQQGIANALSLPFPANIGAAATVAAQAASIVSNIRAVTLAFADGGFVSGPGTTRSDSVPARLSAGEFVVNAAATSRNRNMLEAINAGRRPPINDNQRRGNGQQITIGSVTIQIQGSGNSQEDGEAAARAFTDTVKRIAREEMQEQSRDGGLLTTTQQSVLTG